MKTAFLFPGQGAQKVGMGGDIAAAFPAAAGLFQRASDIVGFDLRQICQEGPAERLNSTAVSQPALFVTCAALLETLRTHSTMHDVVPEVTAGLSMGEYTALYAAGVLTFEDGLELVHERGRAMQAAADATEGTMVSVIGLTDEQVRQLCREAADGDLLEAVNFNCPGQIVISGTRGACERAEALARQYGAIKTVRLDVAGAFHTRMMTGAAETLREALSRARISTPMSTRIIANVEADYYRNADDIIKGLARQLVSPILWQQCMERLLADGVEEFYEIGPGRVLTSLMKRISRKTRVVNISDLESIKALSR